MIDPTNPLPKASSQAGDPQEPGEFVAEQLESEQVAEAASETMAPDVQQAAAEAERFAEGEYSIRPRPKAPDQTAASGVQQFVERALRPTYEEAIDTTGMSQTQAAVAGFMNSIWRPMENLDRGGLLTGTPGSIAEGVIRGGVEIGNLLPDAVNLIGYMSGSESPLLGRMAINFDPEYESPNTVGDITTGISQFATYFIPIGGPVGKGFQSVATRAGAGRVSTIGAAQALRISRARNLTLANVAGYAGSAVVGGMIVDFAAFDAADGGLSSMIRQSEWGKSLPEGGLSSLLEYMDSKAYLVEEGGSPVDRIHARFKLSLEGAAAGVVFDAALTRLGAAFAPIARSLENRNFARSREAMLDVQSRVLTRMKLAEDFISGGGDPARLEIHLNELGYGLEQMQQEHILPAFTKLMAESFGIPEGEAKLLTNMFVQAGGDLNNLFVAQRGGSTLGERLPNFMQEVSRLQQAEAIARVERQVAAERAGEVTATGGTVLTDFAAQSDRVTRMRGRVAGSLNSMQPMPKEELEAAVQGLIDSGAMSEDEWYYGGYKAFLEAAEPGEVVDPRSIAEQAKGVSLYEWRKTGKQTQYSQIRPQGESSNYVEILIGGDPHRFGGELLPPGYSLQPSEGFVKTGRAPDSFVLVGPDGSVVKQTSEDSPDFIPQFRSELDVYAYFSSVNGRNAGVQNPAVRDYYGLMQQRHFREESIAPILAHMRLSERTLDGKTVLYVEELQSDFYNELRVGEMQRGGERGEPVQASGYGLVDPTTGQPSQLWKKLVSRRLVAYARENGIDQIVVPSSRTVGETTSWSMGTKRAVDPETGTIRDIGETQPDPALPPEPGFVAGPSESQLETQLYEDFWGSIRAEANRSGATNPKKTSKLPEVEVKLGQVGGEERFLVVDSDGNVRGDFATRDEAGDAAADINAAETEPPSMYGFDDETGELRELDPDEIEFPDPVVGVERKVTGETTERARGRLIQSPEAFPVGESQNFLELFQSSTTAKGQAFVDSETGVAFVRGLDSGDTSTMAHELGHALHVQMLARGNADEIARLEAAFGVTDGSWSVDNYEDFARSLEAFLRDPSGVTPERAAGLSTIAAAMRDIYTDIRGTPLDGRLTDDQRAFFEGLSLRADLPLQYAPGKFMPRADWSAVIARIRDLDDKGEDWRTILSPEDILATAKYTSDAGGPIRTSFFDIENEDDMLKTLAAFESLFRDLQREGIVSQRMTVEERGLRAMQLFNEISGRDIQDVMNEIAVSDARVVGQGAVNVETGLMMMNLQLRKVLAMRDALEADPTKVNEARFHRAVMQFQMIHRMNAQLRYEAGSTLRQYRRTLDHLQTDESLANEEVALGFIDALGDAAGSIQELSRALKGIKPDAEGLATASRMIDGVRGSRTAEQARSVLAEIYMNGLLSSPKTMMGISTASPLLSMILDGAGSVIGGISQRDLGVLGDAAMNLWRNISNSMVSARYAASVLVDEQPRLLSRGLRDDAFDRRAIRASNFPSINQSTVTGRAIGEAVDVLGEIVRIPTTLIATFDEFFKQMNARTYVQGELIRQERSRIIQEAIASGRIPDNPTKAQQNDVIRDARAEITRRATERFNDVIRDGRLQTRQQMMANAMSDPVISGMTDPVAQAKAINDYVSNQSQGAGPGIVQQAERAGTRHTFQDELGSLGQDLQNLLNRASFRGVPIGRIIIPFFRTPVNLLKRLPEFLPTAIVESSLRSMGNLARGRGFQPGGYPEMLTFHRQYMSQITSSDPSVRAAAEGKQAVGLGLLAWAYSMHESGDLTGSGPENPELRRAWLQTHQPYSIRVNGTYYSYQSMDPFAYHLGITADVMQYLELAEDENKEVGLFSAVLYSTVKQLESKSYMQGAADLFNAMEQPENKGEAYVRNLSASFMPFSSFQRTARQIYDPIVYENRTIVDAITSQSLLFDATASPRYTAIGEPVSRVNENTSMPLRYANLVNPMRAMEASTDPVYMYLAEMQSAIGSPAQSYQGINFTDYSAPVGEPGTAYDYLNKRVGLVTIDGRTLRQTLEMFLTPEGSQYEKAIELAQVPHRSGERQALEGLISEIVTSYRDVARQETIEAVPELQAAINDREYEFLNDALGMLRSKNRNTEKVERALFKLRSRQIGSP